MGKSIKCPMCSLLHWLLNPNVIELSPNYAVLQVSKTGNEMQQVVQYTKPLCEYCHQKAAAIVCVDCNPGGGHVRFCVDCERLEHNRPFFPVQRHRRFPIDQVPVEPPRIICSIHHANDATLYSISLNQFSCDECTINPDWLQRHHLFEPIDQAVRRMRVEAQRLNQYSKEVINRLTNSESTLSKIIYELSPSLSTAKSQIQSKFSEILHVIQERQQNLLKWVDDEVSSYMCVCVRCSL